jgi:hypothetical protein
LVDVDGLKHPFGVWEGLADAEDEAARLALDEYEDDQLDGCWVVELIEKADPDALTCLDCGEPMFIGEDGEPNHVGDGLDGIDHEADAHHVAISDEL